MFNEEALQKLKLLGFNKEKISKIIVFKDIVLDFNKNYNVISKNSEPHIWTRHILDSAQIINYINFEKRASLSDLGTGAGFPGIILSIFNSNPSFHVKLYEKSRVKCLLLRKIKENLGINVEITNSDVKKIKINSNYIVCRAFKKLNEILSISRENIQKKHKIIILKGKNAQEEVNKALIESKFEYKLEKSITDKDSKIIIVDT